MKMQEFLEQYKKYGKIEDMPQEELKKVIGNALNVEMPKINPIPYLGGIDEIVTYRYPELVARCPMTYLKDMYIVEIRFIPDKFIPELKSLRMYFDGYLDLPISHEHLLAKITKEFKSAVSPKKFKIDLDVAVRGGIKTDIFYE